jgi:hypothetical protein
MHIKHAILAVLFIVLSFLSTAVSPRDIQRHAIVIAHKGTTFSLNSQTLKEKITLIINYLI